MQVKKQQLEPDMEQWTNSKLLPWCEYIKAVYFHPAYLTYMQCTSCEMLGSIKIAGRNINDLRYADEIGTKWRETKEPLDESERKE